MRKSSRLVSVLVFNILLIFLCQVELANGIKWLVLASSGTEEWNTTTSCIIKPLQDHQRKLCERHLDLMPAVAEAAAQTIAVCQELFQDRRWNCSSINLVPKFLPDLSAGSREQAFVYGLSSAGVARSAAKACSRGLSTKCGCASLPQEAPPKNFKWGGCGDDTRFGIIFSKWFTDDPVKRGEKKRAKRHLMNSHNNAIGRKILSDSITIVCKCHGVSGSCSVKTCFKSLPNLKVVGLQLQAGYSSAIEISSEHPRKQNGGRRSLNKRLSDTDNFIYYTISPDYCLPDTTLGSLGTKGRECDKDGSGSAGCRSMCCGRGYTTETVEQKYRCDCKYYWCCYVKCKTCSRTVTIHRCR